MCVLSRVSLFVIPWTVALQAPLSMEFSRQGYWNSLPFPAPGDLSHAGTEPLSLACPGLAGGFFTTVSPGKPHSENKIQTVLSKVHFIYASWEEVSQCLVHFYFVHIVAMLHTEP